MPGADALRSLAAQMSAGSREARSTESALRGAGAGLTWTGTDHDLFLVGLDAAGARWQRLADRMEAAAAELVRQADSQDATSAAEGVIEVPPPFLAGNGHGSLDARTSGSGSVR